MISLRIPFISRKAIAFFPFVFFKDRKGQSDLVLVNHEKIHLAQQLELLVIPFYLIYVVNYLYNLISTCDRDAAYRNIIFEKEAYSMQGDPSYLNNRKPYSFLYHL